SRYWQAAADEAPPGALRTGHRSGTERPGAAIHCLPLTSIIPPKFRRTKSRSRGGLANQSPLALPTDQAPIGAVEIGSSRFELLAVVPAKGELIVCGVISEGAVHHQNAIRYPPSEQWVISSALE